MADQYATPSTLSYVSNDDDDVDNMDTDDEGRFGDDGRFGDHESTPGRSCQNEGGLQKYTSPRETSPDCETQEEEMYHDKNHPDPFPETAQATADIDDIDDNFESSLEGRVKSLNHEQARLNEQQENVHSEAREVVAGAAKHTFQKLLPQLEKMKDRLKISHQLLKELQSPPTNNAVTRARASQSPLEQGIEKDALERRLEGALQALDNACRALHGMETPAHECREMQRAASYQEQNNALTVPLSLSACPDAAGIGNGRTNNSSLTGQINSFHFNTADAGNNNMDQFPDFLLPIASDGNGNMTSNTGQLRSPMPGWDNQLPMYAF